MGRTITGEWCAPTAQLPNQTLSKLLQRMSAETERERKECTAIPKVVVPTYPIYRSATPTLVRVALCVCAIGAVIAATFALT